MTDEMMQTLMDCGALGYDDERTRKILGVTPEEFGALMDADGRDAIERGRTMFEFQIDRKLIALAMSGDLRALEKLEQRKRRRAT